MKSELIVDVQPSDVTIALLEDSRLVSLQKESRNVAYAVGDIYLAKVKKLMPGLNAAFVNVGYDKDAFIHYLDLGPNFATYASVVDQLLSDKKKIPSIEKVTPLPEIDKHGSIGDLLTPGRQLLVQIVKEPISSKGPRLTTEITFTGRNMVLIPFAEKVSVSQKIESTAEKQRLRRLIESIKPEHFGVIVRTSAEGKKVQELMREMRQLVKRWEDTLAKAQKAVAPALVYEEESRTVGVLRDLGTPDFEAIHVNDADTYEHLRDYVATILPEKADMVHIYADEAPIFDHFGVTRQIKTSFGKTVSFKSGAYIIIEHTEALHVVDVNSGNRSRAAADQESNALEVNLRAAEEIARQLRLRDMGGIIVVDFIDMNRAEHRQKLYEYMKELMESDRARHNILPLSKFGLMQITRQRVRPDLEIETAETCPSCHGKGTVESSLLFTDTLRQQIDNVVNVQGLSGFTVYVHPFVEAYVKKGLFTSLYGKWRREIGKKFKIVADQSLAYLQSKFVASDKSPIDPNAPPAAPEPEPATEPAATPAAKPKPQRKARTRSAKKPAADKQPSAPQQ